MELFDDQSKQVLSLVMRSLLSIEPYNIVEAVGKRVECKGTRLVVYRKTFIPHMHYY